jgi:hypothetical protein
LRYGRVGNFAGLPGYKLEACGSANRSRKQKVHLPKGLLFIFLPQSVV